MKKIPCLVTSNEQVCAEVRYRTKGGKVEALVIFLIPAYQGSIPECYRDVSTQVFGYPLFANWGENETYARFNVRFDTVEGDNIADVEEKVKEVIREARETLETVKSRNLSLAQFNAVYDLGVP